jgi:hypothetical protein
MWGNRSLSIERRGKYSVRFVACETSRTWVWTVTSNALTVSDYISTFGRPLFHEPCRLRLDAALPTAIDGCRRMPTSNADKSNVITDNDMSGIHKDQDTSCIKITATLKAHRLVQTMASNHLAGFSTTSLRFLDLEDSCHSEV